MHLNVDFVNFERDTELEKTIRTRIKRHFSQKFIASIKVLIKKCTNSKIWKSEIDLVSSAGSILHTQSKSEFQTMAFDVAIQNMEKQIIKIKNEKLNQRA